LKKKSGLVRPQQTARSSSLSASGKTFTTRLGQLLYRANQRNDRRKDRKQASLQSFWSLFSPWSTRDSQGGNPAVFEIVSSPSRYRPQLDHVPRCQKNAAGEKNFFSPRERGGHLFFLAPNLPGLIPVSLGPSKLSSSPRPFAGQVGRISFSPQSLKESQALLLPFSGNTWARS